MHVLPIQVLPSSVVLAPTAAAAIHERVYPLFGLLIDACAAYTGLAVIRRTRSHSSRRDPRARVPSLWSPYRCMCCLYRSCRHPSYSLPQQPPRSTSACTLSLVSLSMHVLPIQVLPSSVVLAPTAAA